MDYPILTCSGYTYDPGRDAGSCVYDAARAERSVEFFRECLVHTKGSLAGKPFELRPWQADVNRTLFGWYRPDGTRRYRQSYISVPRKNGKTTWMGGIGCYMLFTEREAEAENYCAATDREQAGLAYRTIASMIRSNPEMADRAMITDSRKTVSFNESFIRAIPANEEASHGFNIHFLIADELHAWPNRRMYDVLRTGTGAREQPLTVYITTAGYDKQSVCYAEYQYAKGVRDGEIDDPAYLPVVYEAEEKDDWQDPAVWTKANPNYGVSIRSDYFERECNTAKESTSYQNTFRRLHLNQWTSQAVRWLDMDAWKQCPAKTKTVGPVFGGLDLSVTGDLTAWAMVARTENGWRTRCHFWMAEEQLAKLERRDRVPYAAWAQSGLLTTTPGSRINPEWVLKRVVKDVEKYKIAAVGYDPHNCEWLAMAMQEKHGIKAVEVRQGIAHLNAASKELEATVKNRALDHGNNPILNWMAENVEVYTDTSGNIKPCRPKHGDRHKIDGIAATVTGLAVAVSSPEPKQRSYSIRWLE